MEQLIRIDVVNVKEWERKTLYTVPVWYAFVVSSLDTTSATTLKLRINGTKIVSQAYPDNNKWEFFKGFILNAGDIIAVTHAFSWVSETVTMSGSLVTQP